MTQSEKWRLRSRPADGVQTTFKDIILLTSIKKEFSIFVLFFGYPKVIAFRHTKTLYRTKIGSKFSIYSVTKCRICNNW